MTGWNTRGDTGSGVALELSWGPGNGKLNRRGEALTCDTKSFSRFSSRTWHTSPLFSNSWALFNMSFPAGTEETSLATIYQSSILVRAVTACSEERVPRKKAFGGWSQEAELFELGLRFIWVETQRKDTSGRDKKQVQRPRGGTVLGELWVQQVASCAAPLLVAQCMDTLDGLCLGNRAHN